MTKEEVSEKYQIPLSVLEEYESWAFSPGKSGFYDDGDLERLSLILTLGAIGFCSEEIKTYMELVLSPEPTKTQRLAMLNDIRSRTLAEIHSRESMLEGVDYLRYELQRQKEK